MFPGLMKYKLLNALIGYVLSASKSLQCDVISVLITYLTNYIDR